MSAATTQIPQMEGEPAWEVARLFPSQGSWSEYDYIDLTNLTNSLAELTDGRVEVLPMPTTEHQRIVGFLYSLLIAFVNERYLGEVLFAPLRVRLRSDVMREPDIVFMLKAHADRVHSQYWEGADLIVEVVSKDDRDRDLVKKRREYAEAGIPEYWIVDPELQSITVLSLEQGEYVVGSDARDEGMAHSTVLSGFSVKAADVFAAARR